jgi:hypothetical protein
MAKVSRLFAGREASIFVGESDMDRNQRGRRKMTLDHIISGGPDSFLL